MLNKKGIKKEFNKNIFIENAEDKIKENYIEVTLSPTLKYYDTPCLDIKSPKSFKSIDIKEEGVLLEPNKLYLGSTNEYTKTFEFVPLLSGLTELAVLGVEIHITAGFGDVGFQGTWTLEIISSNPVILYPNMTIGKVYFYSLIGDDSIKYNGKYQGQIVPTESRLSTEYNNEEINNAN